MASLSVQGYALTQPSVILHYLRLAVRPVGLCFDYLWPVAQGFWQIVPPLMVVSGFFVLTLSLFCRYSALAFPGLWFFGILSITSSIMPIADLAVEHRMYLPLIAPIVLMVVGCHRLLVRTVGRRASTVGLAGVSAVVMCLSSLTIERNAIYHTEERFWTDVLAKRPLNFRAHVTLASISTKEKHFSEAKMHYRRTIDIISFMPGHFQASRHLGTAHFHLGHYNRALPLLTRTLATVTRKEDLHNMIGLIDLRQGRLTEAADHFTEAVRLSPIVLEYQFNRGLAEMRRRRFDVAETAFRSAVEIDPHDAPSHHGLAKTLWHQGKSGNAIASWKSAIAIDPKYWPSVYDLAWVMATHPDPRLRNGIESFRLATRIVDDSKNPDALALEILAAAYAENGNFSEAVKIQEKSLSMSFDDGGTIVTGTEREQRLAAYRNSKPWRMNFVDVD
jgi:tetratricopeptide (TPR) repeat protein